MSRQIKNKPGSVAVRLKRIAEESRTTYEQILLRYGQERLIGRMSNSQAFDKFVLKGAALFLVWQGHAYRTTRDIDFLGSGSPDLGRIRQMFVDLCAQNTVEKDGLVFDPGSVKTDAIQEIQEYPGVQVHIRALLERARIDLQVDVGFGDAVTPAPERMTFPPLLDLPGPEVMAYPKYTAMAEKFLALARLGIDNSRMKDFYDMVVMFRLFDFDLELLATAIQRTCRARKFEMPGEIPIALTKAFFEDQLKLNLWKGFSQRAGLTVAVGNLNEVIKEISEHLLPVLEIISRSRQ